MQVLKRNPTTPRNPDYWLRHKNQPSNQGFNHTLKKAK